MFSECSTIFYYPHKMLNHGYADNQNTNFIKTALIFD